MAETFTWTNGYDPAKFIIGNVAISTAVDITLTEAQGASAVICITATAASKTVTMGLAEGRSVFVVNAGGTNAFTLKNVSTDSGTSIAAGKVALCTIGTNGALTALVLN